MTKEITKAIILQQLEDKFKLREWEPTRFLFDETVVPIYDIEREIRHPYTNLKTMSITSGPIGVIFFIVPKTEKWTLYSYNVIFMAAGAYKVTGLYIYRKNSVNASAIIYLDMKEGQTASYNINLPVPVILESQDVIYLYIDDYTSTAQLRLIIDVVKEEVR